MSDEPDKILELLKINASQLRQITNQDLTITHHRLSEAEGGALANIIKGQMPTPEDIKQITNVYNRLVKSSQKSAK